MSLLSIPISVYIDFSKLHIRLHAYDQPQQGASGNQWFCYKSTNEWASESWLQETINFSDSHKNLDSHSYRWVLLRHEYPKSRSKLKIIVLCTVS